MRAYPVPGSRRRHGGVGAEWTAGIRISGIAPTLFLPRVVGGLGNWRGVVSARAWRQAAPPSTRRRSRRREAGRGPPITPPSAAAIAPRASARSPVRVGAAATEHEASAVPGREVSLFLARAFPYSAISAEVVQARFQTRPAEPGTRRQFSGCRCLSYDFALRFKTKTYSETFRNDVCGAARSTGVRPGSGESPSTRRVSEGRHHPSSHSRAVAWLG